MRGSGVGRNAFRRAGAEIRDHRVQRDAAAGDENPGLSGGAEIRIDALAAQRPGQGQRRVFLAQRAVGAYRQQALAAALAAAGGGQSRRRTPHVDQPHAARTRRFGQAGDFGQGRMHAADDVQTGFDRLEQGGNPGRGHLAANRSDADHQRGRAPGGRGGGFQFRQIQADGAARQAPLAQAGLRGPVPEAEGGLGLGMVLDLSQEQQVGPAHRDRCSMLRRLRGRDRREEGGRGCTGVQERSRLDGTRSTAARESRGHP